MTPNGTRPSPALQDAMLSHGLRLVAGTTVLTRDGALPVEHLCEGDMIVTRSGLRRLEAITARVVRDAALVRVSASTLGHGRPGDDVLLPADQPILLRDWRAKALYGQSQAVVAVSRLADGTLIRRETVAETRLFTLHFAAPAVIYAGGLEPATQAEAIHVPA